MEVGREDRPPGREDPLSLCVQPGDPSGRSVFVGWEMKTKDEGRSHFRRFQGYDYSRGAAVFVSFGVVGRPKIFGLITNDGELILSEAGRLARETLAIEERRDERIRLMSSVVMPDHVHLRFYIEPNTPDPLVKLGGFVRNFKRWTRLKSSKIGVDFDWEANYHDRICLSREIIDLADKYIANNPLKWALMHGDPPPLRVVEPIESSRFEPDEWWSGVGNLGLIEENAKVFAVRLSRKIRPADFPAVVARLLEGAKKGFVFAGTFISPCERALFDALVKGGYPIVKAIPDKLEMVYRPKGDEPTLFAERRLLYLSRVAASGASRYDAWHGINDAMAKMTALKGRSSGREKPTSLYVLPRDTSGRVGLDWRFG